MNLRNRVAATLAFALALGTGCTQFTAIATAPDNKVFVTKTTSYIVWTTNKMLLCDYASGKASNCTEVTQD